MVIMILGIMMGAIVPNMRSFLSGSALKHTASSLADIIRYSRSAAIERSVVTKLTFMVENQTSSYNEIEFIESSEIAEGVQDTEAEQNTQEVTVTSIQGVLFTVETDPLNMPGQFFPEPLPVRTPKDLGDKVKVAQIIKQSLAGSMEESVVSFDPDGTTSDTMIYLTDDKERIYTIGVIGLTGQVIVWDRAVESFYED